MDDLVLAPCYSPFHASFSAEGQHQYPEFQMDDLVPAPCYSPFQASFSADGQHQYPEFLSSDASNLEMLLGSDDVLDNRDDEVPQADTAASLPPPAAPPVAQRMRPGRKPGSGSSRAAGTTAAVTHVEAERQRRDRLNRLFCDLRAAVPTVSRMDKASLLADAVCYITKLRGRVEQLEAEAEAKRTTAASLGQLPMPLVGSGQELEVRMHGRDVAALRLTTVAVRHAPARLMAALRTLDLPVQHASVYRVGGVTVQDVIVDTATAGLWGKDCLRTALLQKLLQESG